MMQDDMEALIDISNGTDDDGWDRSFGFDSTGTSVLKRGEPTIADRRKTAFIGLGLGMLVGLVPAGVAFAVMFDAYPSGLWIAAIVPGVAAVIGSLIGIAILNAEVRDGFLKVDREVIEYWTRSGTVSIPLSRIFGAGPDRGFMGEILRVCVLADNARGFEFKTPSFSGYEAVSGPARKIGGSVETGNMLARKTIIHHVKERRKAGLPVAELPEYRFKSVQTHREFLVAGGTVVDATFECDGKNLVYENKEGRVRVPVTAVRETKIMEARSKYGRTAYKVTMKLDLSCGFEELKMDILRMPHAEEIDRYCRCLPTLFPPADLEGYWS